MNSSVRIIKRDKTEILSDLQSGQNERTRTHSTRQMTRTVKGWIAELHRRHRDEELTASAFRKMRVTLPLMVLFILCVGTESNCQQAAFPQQGGVINISRQERIVKLLTPKSQ